MSILDRLAKEIDKISGKEDEPISTSSDIGSGGKVVPKKSGTKKKSTQIKTSEEASLMEELIGEDAVDFPEVGDVVQGKVIETSSNAIYLDIEPFGTGIVM